LAAGIIEGTDFVVSSSVYYLDSLHFNGLALMMATIMSHGGTSRCSLLHQFFVDICGLASSHMPKNTAVCPVPANKEEGLSAPLSKPIDAH
jgi:hypothetical protein